MRDQINYGMYSQKLREQLLRGNDLTLEKAMEMHTSAEIAEQQTKVGENALASIEPIMRLWKPTEHCGLACAEEGSVHHKGSLLLERSVTSEDGRTTLHQCAGWERPIVVLIGGHDQAMTVAKTAVFPSWWCKALTRTAVTGL